MVALMRSINNVHKAIARPLGEKCKCSDDTHPAAVSRCLEQGSPTNVRCHIPIEINCRFNFFEFVLHEGIITL